MAWAGELDTGQLTGIGAYRREESTQGASHAMATFVSRQTMNPSFCQNIKQPTEKRLVIVLKSIILHRTYFTFAF